MTKRAQPVIVARKSPKQARATLLVESILEAGLRVLKRDGARRFTTVSVAREAGVSVGSLYQYFPNKEALLFKLQAVEWEETSALIFELLADERVDPLECLRRVVVTFFRSEQQEFQLRGALLEAGARLSDTAEARRVRARARRHVLAFMKRALPSAPRAAHVRAMQVLGTHLSAVAEAFTARSPSRKELDAFAHASADMYCAYLTELELRSR